MSGRSRVACAASALVLSLSTGHAAANGRLPTANQLLFSRGDTGLVVLRTTFGLLLSRDGGMTWAWLCEDALGVSSSSTEDPSLAIAANDNLVAGFSSGLTVSQDIGCNWSFAGGPLADQLVVDLTVRPQAPDVLLALTSTFGSGVADGSSGYANQIFESADDGVHWVPRGAPLDPSAIMTALETAATDANRIYVTGQRTAAMATASIFVSADGGTTWTEHAVALDPNGSESSIYIAAVDPTNEARVYLRTSAQTTLSSHPSGKPSRLLVSDDGGSTFRTALSLTGQMLGFALSSDASMVFAGSVEDGLFVAGATDLSFLKLSSIHVKCLATHGLELWACSDDATGFIAGVSTDGGTTFTAKAHLTAEPTLMCTGDATASAQCNGAPREALCKALPGCDLDGSGATAPGGGVSGHARSPARGCGCSLEVVDSATGYAAVCAFVGLGVARRHARRRH